MQSGSFQPDSTHNKQEICASGRAASGWGGVGGSRKKRPSLERHQPHTDPHPPANPPKQTRTQDDRAKTHTNTEPKVRRETSDERVEPTSTDAYSHLSGPRQQPDGPPRGYGPPVRYGLACAGTVPINSCSWSLLSRRSRGVAVRCKPSFQTRGGQRGLMYKKLFEQTCGAAAHVAKREAPVAARLLCPPFFPR